MSNTSAIVAKGAFHRQRQVGRLLGPALAIIVYWLCGDSLPDAARFTAATATLMAIFWISEAIPLSATALLPIVLFPVLGIVDVDQATLPFAKPVIFLFLGGFMIASAVESSGLHRRVALVVVRIFGGKAGQLLGGCMAATAFLSMWISNTAATVMMIPIATSLIGMLPRETSGSKSPEHIRRLEVCLLLGIAYAANIGGLGTLVGTPPNALLAGFLNEHGISIGFGRWMLLAVPVVILFLVLAWLVLARVVLHSKSRSVEVPQSLIESEYRELGKITQAEWTVIAVFLVTVALWVAREPLSHWESFVGMFPWVARINDASIAIAAAVALFLLPANNTTGERILDWQAASRLPWGVLLLIGGGMSLASATKVTGLDAALAGNLQVLLALHPALLVVVITVSVIFLTEVVSNTAITAALLPVLFGLAAESGSGPMQLLVPATLAASCAFMLPISTPPNAVVFGTGRLSMQSMLCYGFWLNVLGTILIPLMMYLFGWLLIA